MPTTSYGRKNTVVASRSWRQRRKFQQIAQYLKSPVLSAYVHTFTGHLFHFTPKSLAMIKSKNQYE